MTKFTRPLRGRAAALIMGSLLGACLAATPLAAQQLRVASSYKLMTLDPHFATLNENTSLLSHIYERLVYQDETMQLQPGLATGWTRLSDTRWEFRLREGVTFHDGSPFTSADVAFTVGRIQDFLNPPSGGFKEYIKGITAVETPDPLTVIFETATSEPSLPMKLSAVFIMQGAAGDYPTTDELNAGTAPLGTGPYKFAAWRSGETLDLLRHDGYWGGTPDWQEVRFRIVENPAARVAAITAGDVDLVDFIPARDVGALEAKGLSVESVSAARSNFIQFDLTSEFAPGVTDNAGNPIPNPFKDLRVRQALSMAIDRAVLADKILSGFGTAAVQMFPNGLAGTSPRLMVAPPDYDAARALLAEAGYPAGFRLVLAGPAGRYPGDGESLQAVAQAWARIGVQVNPVGVPFSVFNTQRGAGEYGLWYGGCSGETVDVCLKAVLATPDEATGSGALNFGGYSNPAFDALLIGAQALEVGAARDAALAEAADLVMADAPVAPLYHFHHIFGYGAAVASYVMHPRGWTTAMQAKPAAH